ncbi:MAG: sensor histidine kinase [Alphaproteobacteria bacterium]|nr:sensor histidine kinase [Alphaproteobacteria bacterium]
MAELHAEPSPSLFPDMSTTIAEGKGRIRPRARLLKTIGAELISSEVVAVIELVRNSYDADATEVELVFERPETPSLATLEIRDNGHGMSREVLLGPWLEPATDWKSGKHDAPTSGEHSPAGRRRLGSKGVGRFAAQRLGSHLELRTRPTQSESELIALFDWTALERDQYLDQVRIPWREATAEHVDAHGTHLCISRLRDPWTPERFDKLKLGLSRLVSPTMREDFRITVVINGASDEVRPALDAEKAMYAVEGEVAPDGRCTIAYTDINGASETWERTVVWPPEVAAQCGPFRFRINAWDLDREPLQMFLKKTGSKLGLRDFRTIIRDHSGVSLYRDGFRILPYGEPDNDWLRLDRRRVNNPTMRLSNNQILGTIQLSADLNPELKDQTNREGLVTNDAYRHLQEVVLELLGYLEMRRFNARRAMDIDWQRRSSSLPELDTDAAHDQIETLIEGIQKSSGGASETRKVEALKQAVTDFRDSTADAVRHYASLAAVGQMSGLVFRQLRHPVRQIRSDLDLVREDLRSGVQDPEDLQDLLESVERSLRRLTEMEARMEKLDPLAVGRRGRRVSSLNLAEVLVEVIEPWLEEYDRHGVMLELKVAHKRTVRSNREVIHQVVSNLLDNALWAATQGETKTPRVTVELTADGFSVVDSGPGVPEGVGGAVFEPHFSTREDGHGLGLTLTRDLLKTVGGRIELTSSKPATFAVTLKS